MPSKPINPGEQPLLIKAAGAKDKVQSALNSSFLSRYECHISSSLRGQCQGYTLLLSK